MNKNPFSPSFGRLPQLIINQQNTLNDYISKLIQLDNKYQTSLVYGVRGSGKTVFLLNVKKTIEAYENWRFVRLNLGQGNLLFQLMSGLKKIVGIDWSKLLSSIQGFQIMGSGINLQAIQASGMIDYQDVLSTLLEKIKKNNLNVLIAIDEIEVSDDVRAFASVYQTLIGDEYPINLLMTGLPNRISELQNDDTLTFLLRSNRIYLNQLDGLSVSQKYSQIFSEAEIKYDDVQLDQLIESVRGYAYAFQTLGYYAWQEAMANEMRLDSQVIKNVIELSKNDLYRNAYEKLYTDVSEKDRIILDEIARYPAQEVPMKDIAQKLNLKPNYLSVYRARLLDNQLISAPKRGYVRLTLPFFADFIVDWHEKREVF